VIRKLTSGQYRLYSRKKDPKTGKRRSLGTFGTPKEAEVHERFSTSNAMGEAGGKSDGNCASRHHSVIKHIHSRLELM
jgi:hypothetical protein